MSKIFRNKIIFGIILSAILFSLLGRFYELDMDPFNYDDYGIAWGDEGGYIHNARNKILFNDWKLENDLWNPLYISPIFTYLKFISFKIFGVNTFAMRLVPAILGIVSILIVSFLLILKKPKEGIIYFILLSTNITLIAFSRVAMLECVVLFFILTILGLIIYNKKYSWIMAGFLMPFLFFSKIISIFFILAIPLSLILYYLIYKSKQSLKSLFNIVIGGLVSIVLWSFWLLPRLDDWLFMNFGLYSSRISIGLFKVIATISCTLRFSLLNQMIIVLTIASIFFTVLLLRKKQKIPFIDFFLIISLMLFLFQILLTDAPLRRFVMIMPIILLISAKLICKIKGATLHFDNLKFKIDKNTIVLLIIIIYIMTNVVPLMWYFSQLVMPYHHPYTFIENSREISNYIPPGSNVYGSYANALALENTIRPYFSYNKEETILQLFDERKINYAILTTNIFDDNDIQRSGINLNTSKVYSYIKDNFEIIHTLNGKDSKDGSYLLKIYIYKRKGEFNEKN